MNTKMESARAVVRNTDLPTPERRKRLNQLTAGIRQEYDHEIFRIRAEIAALGMSTASAAWQTLAGLVTGVPFSRTKGVASIAKLRVRLAETHTAKFAAVAELKVLKALA